MCGIFPESVVGNDGRFLELIEISPWIPSFCQFPFATTRGIVLPV